MGAEDFSYVLDEVPGTMMFLGGTHPTATPATAAANHSNRVVFDEDAMPDRRRALQRRGPPPPRPPRSPDAHELRRRTSSSTTFELGENDGVRVWLTP
jgi:hypothetical protein